MSNYRNGADLERAARKSLEADGYYVIRSAGSKGAVDLAAFKPIDDVLFVQCKRDGYMTPGELHDLHQICAKLVYPKPLVASWHKDGNAARTVRFRQVFLLLDGTFAANADWTADHEPEWPRIRAARMTLTDPRPEA